MRGNDCFKAKTAKVFHAKGAKTLGVFCVSRLRVLCVEIKEAAKWTLEN